MPAISDSLAWQAWIILEVLVPAHDIPLDMVFPSRVERTGMIDVTGRCFLLFLMFGELRKCM